MAACDAVQAEAKRVQSALGPPFAVDGHEIRVTGSIGVSLSSPRVSAAELLRNADIAMYVAKGQGKGRCEVYQPTTHKTVMRQLELRTDLQRALERDEFILHYQPLVTVETGQISGLEALLRWEHPHRRSTRRRRADRWGY